ncbi:MAG: sigma-70 family RNA polymerase sigma factor [Planctomycetes bacterium]|nr:sigma-70 family RNA polymerase sigma factor [Planctomycetota bacterium]
METERQPSAFEPTRWSIVLGARGGFTPESREAVERLVGIYWGPVYWTLRRGWSRSHEDAKDLTQEFFLRFLERGVTEGYEPERGRFRSFLYAAVKHFMLQERRDRSRLKRGGGTLPFSLDGLRDSGAEPAGDPEQVFHREWVRTILDEASARLRDECVRAGMELRFKVFSAFHDLAGGDRPTYESVAKSLGIGVNDVHHHLKTMRQRLRELVRESVRETLSDPGDLDGEVGLLFR